METLFAEEEEELREANTSEEEEKASDETPEEVPVVKTEKEEKTTSEEPVVSRPSISREDKESVTVITKGTTINGSIISDCSLDVMGTINGDIECLGKLSISGKVTGNSMASEVFVNTDRLEGNITSEGCVKVALNTIIVGDITASSGVIAGAVKGQLDISGPIVLDSTAIIKGDVKAKSVQMNNGAILEGHCSLSYSSVDIDNIFE